MTEVLREHLEGQDRWGRTVVTLRAAGDLLRSAAVRRTRTRFRGSGRSGWVEDLGYAARTMARRPSFALVAVVTVAFGVGLTTAVASLVYTVQLAPSPYQDPDRIVQIALEGEGRRSVMIPTDDVGSLRGEAADYLTLGTARFQDVAVGSEGAPERVRAVVLSGATLPMLGVDPLLGRLPGSSDDISGGACVTAISHDLWSRRFDASSAIVGETVRLDGEPCVVLAVMPEGFAYPAPYYAPGELWLLAGPAGVDWSSAEGWFLTFARLRPGVDDSSARARLETIATETEGESRFTIMRWAEPIRESSRRRLLMLLAGGVIVLIVAGVNLTTLQVGRNVQRRGEIATRVALGASRSRLARLLAAEGVVLFVLGTAAALVVATLVVDLILALRSFYIPRMEEVAIDGTAVLICVALTAGLTAVTTALASVALYIRSGPALPQGRGRIVTHGPGGRHFGRLLVTVETGLAILLLSGAGLLMRSYQELTSLDPGFAAEEIFHGRTTPPRARYPDDASLVAFAQEVAGRVRALPGVESAALANVPPGVGSGAFQQVEISGRSPDGGEDLRTAWRSTTPGYFEALGMHLVRGRGLEESRGSPGAVVVNEAFVRRFLPDQEVLGTSLRARVTPSTRDTWSVVGVVEDVHEEYAHTDVPPTVYARYEEAPARSIAILARTAGEPLTLTEPIRRAVAEVDPDLPLYAVRSLDVMLAGEHDLNRLAMVLLALFSATALLLAVVGIYGVVAHQVGRRFQEMGIRLALGARDGEVVRLILLDALVFAGVGCAVGLTLAVSLGDSLRVLAPEWVGMDAGALGAATAAVLVVATAAAWFPARRAGSADPVTALRAE